MPFNTTVSLLSKKWLNDRFASRASCYAMLSEWIHRLKLDKTRFQSIDGLYCVGDSCFPGQGVIAVAFSGVMCAHRVAADIGKPLIFHSWKLLANWVYNGKKKNIYYSESVEII